MENEGDKYLLERHLCRKGQIHFCAHSYKLEMTYCLGMLHKDTILDLPFENAMLLSCPSNLHFLKLFVGKKELVTSNAIKNLHPGLLRFPFFH